MLRRHRQIKTQIQQVLDAVLFGFSFWLAWVLRADPRIIEFFRLGEPLKPFDTYFWLYLVVIFVGPLILEGQGFYDRPVIAPRRTALWALFKGCLFTTIGLIIV